MRRLLLTLCLLASPAWADSEFRPSTSIDLRDEGVSQGQVKRLDCVGTGVTCTRSGVTGTVTISAGGGAGNFLSTTINFGSSGSSPARVTITGQAWVSAASIILCAGTSFSTADRSDGQEDAAIEHLTVSVANRVAGTGFDVIANVPIGVAYGQYLIHCTGA